MYAVCVEYYGSYGALIPMGNLGLQKLHNKTLRGWKSETTVMRRNTIGNVYVVNDFTQEMCEMSQGKLADYVQNNHIAIL